MSVIYENKSEMTLEKYLYQCNTPIGKKAKKDLKRWKISQISAMAASIVLTVFCFLYDAEPIGVISAIFFLTFAYNLAFKRNVKNKKMYNQIIASQPDGKWERTISFDKDIKVTDGNSVTTFQYKDFIRFDENAKYYLLFRNENAVLRVEKGAFVKGEEETFPRFIKNKIKKQGKN